VYWIPLYELLEERGIEAYVVNARHLPEAFSGMRSRFMEEGFKGAEEPAEPEPTPDQQG